MATLLYRSTKLSQSRRKDGSPQGSRLPRSVHSQNPRRLSSIIQCRLCPSLMECSQTQFRAGMLPCPRLLNGKTSIFAGSMTAAYSACSCGSMTMRYGTPMLSRARLVKRLSHRPFEIMYIGYLFISLRRIPEPFCLICYCLIQERGECFNCFGRLEIDVDCPMRHRFIRHPRRHPFPMRARIIEV